MVVFKMHALLTRKNKTIIIEQSYFLLPFTPGKYEIHTTVDHNNHISIYIIMLYTNAYIFYPPKLLKISKHLHSYLSYFILTKYKQPRHLPTFSKYRAIRERKWCKFEQIWLSRSWVMNVQHSCNLYLILTMKDLQLLS